MKRVLILGLFLSFAAAPAVSAPPQKLSVAILPFSPGLEDSHPKLERSARGLLCLEPVSFRSIPRPRLLGWCHRMPAAWVPVGGSGYQLPLDLIPWDSEHQRERDPARRPLDTRLTEEGREELGVALAEALRDDLRRLKALSIIEPGPVEERLLQDGWEEGLLDLGRKLAAEVVLSGRFALRGEHLRLRVFAFNVESRKAIFSREVEGGLEELFTLQRRVARAFVKQLGLPLSAAEEMRLAPDTPRPTSSLQAYILYVQGRRFSTMGKKEDVGRQDLLAQALEPGAEGDFDKAIERFKKALQLDWGFALAHYELGLVFLKANVARANWLAAEAFRKAVHYDPQLVEAYKLLGDLFLLGQEPLHQQQAIWAYQRVIALDPQDVQAYLGLGKAQVALRRFDEAIATYRKALAVDPTNPKAYYELGKAYFNGKDLYEEAQAAYQKAIALDPSFLEAYLALGQLYEEQGLPQEAVTQYRRAIALDPTHPGAYYGLASALEGVDKKQAISAWSHYLHLASGLPSEQEWVGVAKRHLKRLEEGDSDGR